MNDDNRSTLGLGPPLAWHQEGYAPSGRSFLVPAQGSSPQEMEEEALYVARGFFGKDARLWVNPHYAVSRYNGRYQADIDVLEFVKAPRQRQKDIFS